MVLPAAVSSPLLSQSTILDFRPDRTVSKKSGVKLNDKTKNHDRFPEADVGSGNQKIGEMAVPVIHAPDEAKSQSIGPDGLQPFFFFSAL